MKCISTALQRYFLVYASEARKKKTIHLKHYHISRLPSSFKTFSFAWLYLFFFVPNQEVAGTLNNDNSLSSNPNDIEIKYIAGNGNAIDNAMHTTKGISC